MIYFRSRTLLPASAGLLGGLALVAPVTGSAQIRTVDLPPSTPARPPSLEPLPNPAPEAPSVPSQGLQLDLPSLEEARRADGGAAAAPARPVDAKADAAAAEARAAAEAEAAQLRAANARELAAAEAQSRQIAADKQAQEARLARYREQQQAHEAALTAYQAELAAAEAARRRWEADVAACQAGDRSRCSLPVTPH